MAGRQAAEEVHLCEGEDDQCSGVKKHLFHPVSPSCIIKIQDDNFVSYNAVVYPVLPRDHCTPRALYTCLGTYVRMRL